MNYFILQILLNSNLNEQNKKLDHHFYFNEFTTTSETGEIKTLKVIGSGIVFISATTECDNTSSYGNVTTLIYKNEQYLACDYNRLETTNTARISANVSAFVPVVSNDIITLKFAASKGGTKFMYYHCMCIGNCTVEEQ